MNILFLASTLPFPHLRSEIQVYDCDRIYFANDVLREGFVKSKNNNCDGIKYKVLSSNRLIRFITILLIFMRAKQIHIFHECGWLLLDLVSLLFRSKVKYTEIVTVAGRHNVENLKTSQLHLKILSKAFNIYQSDKVNGGGVYFLYALRRKFRPIFIDAKSCLKKTNIQIETRPKKGLKSVLFITGSEGIKNEATREIYCQAISVALEEGFRVAVKDHPSVINRIWSEDFFSSVYWRKVEVKDPVLPLDFMDLSEFNVFISIASTGLSQIGNSDATISIINLFDLANREKLKIRLKWLEALECFPHLPTCIDTFREVLIQRIQ